MKEKIRITETYSFAFLLIFAGGFLNCYSFILRGGVLANVQTGNLLQFSYYLSEGNWDRAIHFLIPVLTFIVGTFLAKYAFDFWCGKDDLRWSLGILTFSIIAFFFVGVFHESLPDLAANTIIAFCAAMQYCDFRQFGPKAPYATIFCTGNMRSLTENCYAAFVKKDREGEAKAKGYAMMIGGFMAGVVCCNYICKLVGDYAIWAACLVLSVNCVRLILEMKKEKKTEN